MNTGRSIRVMLVDDHEMVRLGIEAFIRLAPDMDLAGQARDGEEAVRLCEEFRPDVILMDMVMPRMNGVEAIKMIHQRHPHIAIIAITSFEDDQLVGDALQAGATSYLHKNVTMSEMHDAVRKTYAGRRVFSLEATQALVNLAAPRLPSYDLTEREKSILALLIDGHSNPEIAERLVIGRTTVATHVSNILSKLGVKSRAEAVALAVKNKILLT